MLGSLILYHKGMRIMMFQVSGFDYNEPNLYKPQHKIGSLTFNCRITNKPNPEPQHKIGS